MNLKRIAALIGALLLVGLYLSTLVFALMGSPNSKNLLMASVFCTIAIPVFLYAWQLACRMAKRKDGFDPGEPDKKEKGKE